MVVKKRYSRFRELTTNNCAKQVTKNYKNITFNGTNRLSKTITGQVHVCLSWMLMDIIASKHHEGLGALLPENF